MGADADRWQSVFVDAARGHGLLGQVEGRASADVTAWPADQDAAWRQAVGYVHWTPTPPAPTYPGSQYELRAERNRDDLSRP